MFRRLSLMRCAAFGAVIPSSNQGPLETPVYRFVLPSENSAAPHCVPGFVAGRPGRCEDHDGFAIRSSQWRAARHLV